MGVSPTRIYVIGSISAQPLNLPNPIILQSYTKKDSLQARLSKLSTEIFCGKYLVALILGRLF